MTKKNFPQWITNQATALLWIASGVLSLGLIMTTVLLPEKPIVSIVVGVLLVGSLGGLVWRNKQALINRRSAYGLYSLVTTILVVAIVGVLNFFGYQYPQKLDLTKNKLHTFSTQSVELMKNLENEIQATFFTTLNEQEKFRPVLDEYKGLSRKFNLEYVDPDRNPTRAKQAGIKKINTLVLEMGERSSKIEEPNEEKITNEIIKLTRKESLLVCNIEGHGERSFDSTEADGYSNIKKGIEELAYKARVVQLAEQGKVPEDCSAIIVAGPSKAFFDQEIKIISDYLDNGGKAFFALDINLEGRKNSSELIALLEKWGVKSEEALIVDPLSRMLGVDAAVPIIPTFSVSHAITQDFRKDIRNTNCFFPFTRPLDLAKELPKGLNGEWLARTSPQSWGEFNLKTLGSGKVSFDEVGDKRGPLTVAIAISGIKEGSKTNKESRLVVFGTSLFAVNNYARLGLNSDLFLNSMSWLVQDEKGITIRAKDDDPGKVELTQKTGALIFWISVIIAPALISIAGVVIWARRRKM